MKSLVSRLFIWGFDGTSVSTRLKKVLRDFPPAGLILFRRNIESPSQLRRLTRNLRSFCDAPLLIGIDQEGGRVSRLPPPFIQYPPAATWGQIFQRMSHRRGSQFLRRIGRFMGLELKGIGINIDFAPVLDVLSNPRNPVIGDRAFSDDPEIVIQTALPFAQGLRESGIIPCGKHFPGHGDTWSDSHQSLPRVNRSSERLKRCELIPFRAAVRSGIPALMTAHVVYPCWDPKRPASLSPKILGSILRDRLRFRGVVISDDLDMKAISKKWDLIEATLLALEAGVDLPLICKGFEERGSIVEAVTREVLQSPALQEAVSGASSRLRALIRKIPKLGG